jgi:hypothetical protein
VRLVRDRTRERGAVAALEQAAATPGAPGAGPSTQPVAGAGR